jgi:hypothetical protein
LAVLADDLVHAGGFEFVGPESVVELFGLGELDLHGLLFVEHFVLVGGGVGGGFGFVVFVHF